MENKFPQLAWGSLLEARRERSGTDRRFLCWRGRISWFVRGHGQDRGFFMLLTHESQENKKRDRVSRVRTEVMGQGRTGQRCEGEDSYMKER